MLSMVYWLTAVFMCIIFEMGHPSLFFFLSFSLGAFMAALSTLATEVVIIQGIVFVVGSLLSLGVLRWWATHTVQRNHYRSNMDGLIGKKALVVQVINPPEAGNVKIQGDIWLARCQQPIEAGMEVEIIQVVGSHLVVKKIVERNIHDS
jgi:membrane protein implicated in regulation of membrane protease activity